MAGAAGRLSANRTAERLLDGQTPSALAAELTAYAEMGIGHVQLVLDPITQRSIAALAPVLDLLDQ
jgi:hypothetical protein